MLNLFKYLKSDNNDWIFMFVINNAHNQLEKILKKQYSKEGFQNLKII